VKPLPLHLAVQGSRSKVNCGVTIQFEYQKINIMKYFDIINLSNYDLILGTPFLYQHKVILALNEPSVKIGTLVPEPMKGKNVSWLYSRSAELVEEDLGKIRTHLMDYVQSQGLFNDPGTSPLPPLRDINHEILLMDETKIYPWQPSRCPEVFKEQWVKKKQQYLDTGRWRVTTAQNTVPLLCIPKPNKPKDKPELHTAIDLQAQNSNTYKMSAPLLSKSELNLNMFHAQL
jgi:hypothetical protein